MSKYVGEQVATVGGKPVHVRRVSVNLRSQIMAAGRVNKGGEITDFANFSVTAIMGLCVNPDGSPFYSPGDRDDLLDNPDRVAEVDELVQHCMKAVGAAGTVAAKN